MSRSPRRMKSVLRLIPAPSNCQPCRPSKLLESEAPQCCSRPRAPIRGLTVGSTLSISQRNGSSSVKTSSVSLCFYRRFRMFSRRHTACVLLLRWKLGKQTIFRTGKECCLQWDAGQWGKDPMDFKMSRSHFVALRQFRTML
jgi:hypothetical protein